MAHIRVLSLCLFGNGTRILAARGVDEVKKEVFFRPFGGGVELGERSDIALEREISEELGQSIAHPILLDVIENLYEFNGKPGHEIVFVYNAKFEDESIYDCPIVQGIEAHKQLELQGHWLEVDDVLAGRVLVYPSGIERAIRKFAKRERGIGYEHLDRARN